MAVQGHHQLLLEPHPRRGSPSQATRSPGHERTPSLADLLRGFPEELQEIAIYYFVDEMSQDEIARIAGISQRTVSNRLTAFRNLAKAAWTNVFEEAPETQ